MAKKINTLLFFIFAFFIFVFPACADEKVQSSVNMQYAISASGMTHVTAHITLTNTTQSYYVSSYALVLGFPQVSNVVVSDTSGPLAAVVKQTPTGEEVTVNFTNSVAGQGKTLPFTLSFDSPDIANQNGTLWEVNIPGMSNQSDFSDFSVDISVPQSWGSPTFIKPQPKADGPLDHNIHFTKTELGKSGISLTFGKSQVYAYSLLYHIQNPNLFPVTTDIALPPTTNYQDVELDTLSPKPSNVVLDSDGNWLARYHLDASQKLTIAANGLIHMSLTPKPVDLATSDRQMYLKPQQYWDVHNSQIASLAKSLQSPEAIYDYVATHLTYDFAKVTRSQVRLGAVGILQNPTAAVCLEFTDLFIAIARAAGIPAREVDGFAYTQNPLSRPLSLSQDILHAWPEYYDDATHTWIMVDPTWGNTTGGVDYFHILDFDHVAFVVKGISSIYPVPAGGYKIPGQENTKDVSVEVSPQKITASPTVNMDAQLAPTFVAGLPIMGQVTLENTGVVLFPLQPMTLTAHFLHPNVQFIDAPAIPPFGTVSKTFAFAKPPFLTNAADIVTISVGGKSLQLPIRVVPFTIQTIVGGGIILVVLITGLFIIARQPRRV